MPIDEIPGLLVGLFAFKGLVDKIAGADLLQDFLLACFLVQAWLRGLPGPICYGTFCWHVFFVGLRGGGGVPRSASWLKGFWKP